MSPKWRWLLGTVIVGLLCLAAFAGWCNVPLTDPATLAMVRAQVESQAARRKAIPPAENGYTVLRELWERPELQALPNLVSQSGSVHKAVTNISGPTLERALRLYPQLLEALDRPHFAWPPTLSWDDALPIIKGSAAVSQTLACLTGYFAAHGDYPQALRAALANLRLSTRLMGQGGAWIQDWALKTLDISSEPVLSLVQSGKLNETQLRLLLEQLDRMDLRPQIARCMDAQLVLTLDALAARQDLSLRIPLLGRFYRRRQTNLTANYFLARREDWQALRLPAPAPIGGPGDLREARLPDLDRMVLLTRFDLTDLAAARLLAGLQLYRFQHGAYPPGLEDLAPSVLPQLPPSLLEGGKWVYALKPGGDFSLVSDSLIGPRPYHR